MTTYWCDIGTSGSRTPTIRAISAANMPPQSTTVSQSMLPLSVCTRVTRPRSVSMAVTRVCGCTCTPFSRARFASA